MIKILELIDGGFVGGGQVHILSVCRNLDTERFIPIVAASPEGKFKELVLSSGVPFYDLNLPKFLGVNSLKKIDKLVNAENINIIHAHGGVAGMYAGYYKRYLNSKIKTVHTIHGIHYIHSKSLFRKHFSMLIEKSLVNYYDSFICVSNDDYITAENLKLINPEKTSVIHNGIDLNRFASVNMDNGFKYEFGITDSDFVIGNVSRFDEQKNQSLLVKIMPALIKHIPSVKLLLVGDGELLDSVKSLALKLKVDDNVIFAGARNDVDRFYHVFDVFAFPSLWEGLSLTLLESIASGCAVISSNIPANKELISHDVNGLLFDLNDENNLVENILKLFNDRSLRIKLSDCAVESSKIFDEKSMTRKIEFVYSKLINN